MHVPICYVLVRLHYMLPTNRDHCWFVLNALEIAKWDISILLYCIVEEIRTRRRGEGHKIHASLDVVLATLARTGSLRDQDGLIAIENLEVRVFTFKNVVTA